MNQIFKANYTMTTSGLFIILIHVFALISLPLYLTGTTPGILLVSLSLLLLYLSETGITAGYHRLFSHPNYRTVKIIEVILLWFGTLTLQGSALKWSYDHRLHHANVDNDGDPYNIKLGFWHAHVLWLFTTPNEIDEKVIPDLIKNKLLLFQHNNYYFLAVFTNVTTCLFIGIVTGDIWGGFILAGLVRIVLSYHLTWFINSLAHWWGEKSYSKELTARDNAVLAVLTVGEGYHNYHHTFPGDYRNGIKWYHFDPTKWLIYSLSKLKLAFDLHKYEENKIIKQLIKMDKSFLISRINAIKLVPEKLKHLIPFDDRNKNEAIEAAIIKIASSLISKRDEITDLITKKKVMKKMKGDRSDFKILTSKIKISRRSYSEEWRKWTQICSIILGKKEAANI